MQGLERDQAIDHNAVGGVTKVPHIELRRALHVFGVDEEGGARHGHGGPLWQR